MKKCIIENCENECEKGRKYCKRHYLDRRSELRREKKAKGLKYETRYIINCEICGREIEITDKHGRFCKDCFKEINRMGNNTSNNYCYNKRAKLVHRLLVEEKLNRKLGTNEVVHHLDGNPKNNIFENLIVLERGRHMALHKFLNIKHYDIIFHFKEKAEEKWKELLLPLTLTWLEENNIEVIKMWEI